MRSFFDVGLYELEPSDTLRREERVNLEGLTIANRHLRDVLVAKGY